MKTKLSFSFISNFYFHLLATIFLSLSSMLTLSACQKTTEPEPTAEVDLQGTPVATSIDDNQNVENAATNAQQDVEIVAEAERDINLTNLENNIGAAGVTPNAETTIPSPGQALTDTQVTDMRYRSTAGETLSVIFETSATGVLNAIITLPNNTQMTLSAPEGQGNNPTYRSTDGNVELVSHKGGSAIDLIQNNKVTSFEAISAEAEVITQT